MSARDLVRAWQAANPRIDHQLVQGTPEWQAFRAKHYGASEAAAMLGTCKYTSRGELLRKKFSGGGKEVDAALQKVFDRGHETEADARPIVEDMLGEDLYPVVCSRGKLSASCDGLTMDDGTAFEHKQFEKGLFEAVSAGILPDQHGPQCQQVLLITGADRLYFVCSDGTRDNFAGVWVDHDYDMQAKIIAGWNQFEVDLAGYKAVDMAPAAVAAPIENLPALTVTLTGEVISSNLAEFETITRQRIQAINTNLTTDQHFADADLMTKFLKDAEDKLKVVKDQALSQTASINELFRTIDRISEEARAKRLELEKLVKARKETLRAEIVRGGKDAYEAHILSLNQRLGRALLATAYKNIPNPDFAAAISGKRSFQSMRDAVDAALANAKLESNSIADKADINLKHFSNIAEQYHGLFRDLDALLFKPADDFALIVKSRIDDHKAAEQKRLDDERERIRKEEEEKATRKAAEDAQKAQAALATATPGPSSVPAPMPSGLSTSPRNVRTIPTRRRPTAEELVLAVSERFAVDDATALGWLAETNFNDELARRTNPTAA